MGSFRRNVHVTTDFSEADRRDARELLPLKDVWARNALPAA